MNNSVSRWNKIGIIKKLILWPGIFFLLLLGPAGLSCSSYLFQTSGIAFAQNRQLVTQEVRYRLLEASEVFFVWGIDGWNVAPEEIRPTGTIVKDGLMYTPTVREGDTFIARVQVPAETDINYGFMVTRLKNNVSVNIWEASRQTITRPGGVIEMQSTLNLGQDQLAADAKDDSIVTQEIRYRMPEAGEVFLVWGINGWNIAPERLRPAGTVLKDGLMYTPMAGYGDTFVVTVRVPSQTQIKFGFMITKKRNGIAVEVWENGNQATGLVAGKQGVVEIQTSKTLAQARELPKDFNSGLHLLLGSSLALGLVLVLILKRILKPDDRTGMVQPAAKIMATGASLYFFFWLIRLNIVGLSWISAPYSLIFVPTMLAVGYYDLLYVVALTLLFLVFTLLSSKNLKVQGLIYLVYTAVGLISLLIAFTNIRFVQMLGTPINYQWVYYSDFLKSEDAQNAILTNLSSTALLNLVALSAAMIVVSRLLICLIQFWPRYHSKRLLLMAAVMPLFVYLPFAHWYISTTEWEQTRLVNPINSVLHSFITGRTHSALFTMEVPPELAEFHPVTSLSPENVSMQPGMDNEVRNVLIFVLESVPAEYIELYGGSFPVTPELNRYRQQSLLFNNIYAHAPASNKSLVSILSSIYPWLSYQSLTREHPDVELPTLSSELKKYGYRTAFLSAGDIKFQRGDEFLAHQQFDKLADHQDLACEGATFESEKWSFLDGVDEACLSAAFAEWIGEDPKEPFFAMLWTVSTHYPYFVAGKEIDYGVNDSSFNRYLNALSHTDRAVGQLLQSLERRDLLESTLVVLVGDHGEAFGRHGQTTHGSNIYEENIHVPFILINPGLFRGGENPTVGGHVDVAPTILDILNLPPPAAWQGQSLFSQNRTDRTYFYSPWSDFLFGYREDNLKFIYNATKDNYEIYDLLNDPFETTNLAEQQPEVVSRGHLYLAAWVQYHDEYMTELFRATKQPVQE